MLVLAVLLCACVGLSAACSCFPYRGPDRFCDYDLIFRGMAVAEYEEREEPIDFSDPNWEYYPYKDWVYTVRVDQAIVMPANLTDAKNITLRTPVQGSLCGVRFRLDVDVIFFAYITGEGHIETGLCEPNAPWVSLSAWDRELITDHIADYCAARKEKEVNPLEP